MTVDILVSNKCLFKGQPLLTLSLQFPKVFTINLALGALQLLLLTDFILLFILGS